jgi:aspartyl aminopeptidase
VLEERSTLDSFDLKANKDKIEEGKILENMMASPGGKWLSKWFDSNINLSRILSAHEKDRLKISYEIEGINKLKNQIAQAIETRYFLEGEK